jgi:spore coat protein U-like protein
MCRRGRAVTRTQLLIAAMATMCLLGASTADAAPSCTIATTSVNFGSYNVFTGSATDSTGTITIDCNGSAHDIIVTLSKGASSSFSPRTMTKGSEVLSYNLYRDAARTTVWGDGSGGTSTYTNPNPPNAPLNVTVYGRVPAGQDVSAGVYSDTVSAVINF